MQITPRPSQRPQSLTPPSRPVATTPSTKAPQSSTQQPQPTKKSSKQLAKKPLLIAAVIAAIIVACVAGYHYANNQIMSDRYQAVFLSNGQVYFGKLHGYYSDRPYMTNVYYFQANGQTGSNAEAQGDQLLVALGQEIHAPENKLLLNKDSILFVENLTTAGKVTDAINKNAANSAEQGGITR